MVGGITLLDGGMGRELKRIGAPFKQPEWSALALIEGPDFVAQAHQSFVRAGADVITTNSYALVPFHLGEARFAARGRELADLAGRVARQVADRSTHHKVAVAGSLPPLFGSYRPDLYDDARAQEILAPLVAGLAPHVDHWLVETQSAVAEVEAAAKGLAGTDKPVWFSFTLEDGADDAQQTPRLRSGEAVTEAVRRAAELGAAAILFNCSQPEVMGPALDAATKALAGKPGIKLGVYANAFPPQPKDAEANSTLHELRDDLDPRGYLGFVQGWIGKGATIVGGCCGIGPEHIATMRGALKN